MHGLAARWQAFAPLIPRLTHDWHLFALDLRGHGESDHTPGRYGIGEFVADVDALLTEVVARPVVLYGHSVGGWIALMMASAFPEKVRALVIGDTAVYPESIDPDMAVSYLANMPMAMRSLATSLQQVDDEVMAGFRSGALLEGYDPEAVLPGIGCPTLLLQADPEREGLMTDKDVERALARIPHAEHVRFEGIGHGLHVEDASAVGEAVAAFLGTLP